MFLPSLWYEIVAFQLGRLLSVQAHVQQRPHGSLYCKCCSTSKISESGRTRNRPNVEHAIDAVPKLLAMLLRSLENASQSKQGRRPDAPFDPATALRAASSAIKKIFFVTISVSFSKRRPDKIGTNSRTALVKNSGSPSCKRSICECLSNATGHQ